MIDPSHFFANGTIPLCTVVFSALAIHVDVHEHIAALATVIRLTDCFVLDHFTLMVFETPLVFEIAVAFRTVHPGVYLALWATGRHAQFAVIHASRVFFFGIIPNLTLVTKITPV